MEEQMEKQKEDYKWGKHLMFVASIGLIGLVISIYLLMDFKDPLLNIVQLSMDTIFGRETKP